MESIIETFIPAIAITFTFGIPGILIFWFIHSRHKERMKLIEKGMTPDEVKTYFKEISKKPRNPFTSLKWGILFVAVGAGGVLSYILTEVTDMSDGITPAILLLFAGLGFIIYYAIASAKMKGNGSEGNAAQVNQASN